MQKVSWQYMYFILSLQKVTRLFNSNVHAMTGQSRSDTESQQNKYIKGNVM